MIYTQAMTREQVFEALSGARTFMGVLSAAGVTGVYKTASRPAMYVTSTPRRRAIAATHPDHSPNTAENLRKTVVFTRVLEAFGHCESDLVWRAAGNALLLRIRAAPSCVVCAGAGWARPARQKLHCAACEGTGVALDELKTNAYLS